MTFSIANWKFDPTTRTLTYLDQHTSQLTEQQTTLLLVLCEKEGEVVSPAELEQKVWDGNVTDNTIKTNITNLRKCFDYRGSEGKQIVVNVRGKGYKLIAVKKVQTDPLYFEQGSSKFSFSLKKWLKLSPQWQVVLGLTLITLLAMFGLNVRNAISEPDKTAHTQHEMTILTYEKGAEMDASFHHAGEVMAYLSFADNVVEHQVLVRDLTTNKIISFPQYELSGSPHWVGDKLFFQVYENEQCQIVYATYSGNLSFTEPTPLTSCGAVQSVSPIEADSYREWLYFSYKENANSPFVIKRINLRTKAVQQLTTDGNENFGAYSMALSPNSSKLAYLTMSANSQVTIRLLDLNSFTIQELYKESSYALDILWDSNNELLIPFGKKLYRYNIDTQIRTVARSFDERVYSISKSLDGEYVLSYGFLFASTINTLDGDKEQVIYQTESQIGQLVVNGDTLYFVGQMQGNNQIWQWRKGELVALTDYQNGERITSVSISPDGATLSYLEGNDVHLIYLNSGNHKRIHLGENLIKDAVFSCDGSYLYFTNKVNGVWQLNKLKDINLDPYSETLRRDIYGIQLDCELELAALSNTQNEIVLTDFKVINKTIELDNYIADLNWKFYDGLLYFTEKGQLYKASPSDMKKQLVHQGGLKINSFSFRNELIYFTQRAIGKNQLIVIKGLNNN